MKHLGIFNLAYFRGYGLKVNKRDQARVVTLPVQYWTDIQRFADLPSSHKSPLLQSARKLNETVPHLYPQLITIQDDAHFPGNPGKQKPEWAWRWSREAPTTPDYLFETIIAITCRLKLLVI